ncbi:hypothetical protein QEH56_18820, partial [Pelagicoccus enzymogenes]|uniref:hypothetical protein n=1 Tax=Pelagicoccus enzymogenes TaxID=2773457 RepID=UPI00280E8FE0
GDGGEKRLGTSRATLGLAWNGWRVSAGTAAASSLGGADYRDQGRSYNADGVVPNEVTLSAVPPEGEVGVILQRGRRGSRPSSWGC